MRGTERLPARLTALLDKLSLTGRRGGMDRPEAPFCDLHKLGAFMVVVVGFRLTWWWWWCETMEMVICPRCGAENGQREPNPVKCCRCWFPLHRLAKVMGADEVK